MIIMICGLLICCSLPLIGSLTQLTGGENLICPAPRVGESQINLGLPFYTSGFE